MGFLKLLSKYSKKAITYHLKNKVEFRLTFNTLILQINKNLKISHGLFFLIFKELNRQLTHKMILLQNYLLYLILIIQNQLIVHDHLYQLQHYQVLNL